MKLLIDQLIVLDRAFYRYYLEMLLTLEHTHALTPWQMSILLWRAKSSMWKSFIRNCCVSASAMNRPCGNEDSAKKLKGKSGDKTLFHLLLRMRAGT